MSIFFLAGFECEGHCDDSYCSSCCHEDSAETIEVIEEELRDREVEVEQQKDKKLSQMEKFLANEGERNSCLTFCRDTITRLSDKANLQKAHIETLMADRVSAFLSLLVQFLCTSLVTIHMGVLSMSLCGLCVCVCPPFHSTCPSIPSLSIRKVNLSF